MQCSYCSNKFDPFLDLSLEIHKADSLYKALAHFTAKEQLDGGAREYQCDQCKQKVKASKQLTVHKAPQVLAVHLKRFSSHAPGQKVDKRVAFEPTLDLKPFVSGPYVSSTLCFFIPFVTNFIPSPFCSSSAPTCTLLLVLLLVCDIYPFVNATTSGWGFEIHSVWSSCSLWLEHSFGPLLLLCSHIKWHVV